MTDSADLAALDALPTEELRSRAFALAEGRRDVSFFWDLLKHLPAAARAAGDDSFSATAASISDFLELFREFRGEHLEGAEPMLRAHFIDYIAAHTG